MEVSPNRGSAGSLVKIFGSDFSPSAGMNKVAFARPGRRTGISAVVTSAVPTQLVVRVPPGAATGPITVSCPNGSATTAQPFVVTASEAGRGAPAISEFSPASGTPGTEVTLKGSGFDTTAANNRVTFNGGVKATLVSATATALVVTVPRAGSGRISVMTSVGIAMSGSDFFIPPAPFTVADVAFTGRINVGGGPRAIALQRPESFAMQLCGIVLFDGAANQRLQLRVAASTLARGKLALHGPDARALGRGWSIAVGAELTLDLPVLPATGTYTVIVDPQGLQTGTLTLSLARAPV